MAHIMTKQGHQDNANTYEHFCDTTADMALIDPKQITLGSVCLVLEGASGGLEIYLAKSDKTWVKLTGAVDSDEEPDDTPA